MVFISTISSILASTDIPPRFSNTQYKLNVSVGYNYGKVSTTSAISATEVPASEAKYSVAYHVSSNGGSFRARFKIYNVREQYSGTANILSKGARFTKQPSRVQYRIDYPYELYASRENIIVPSRNVNGT